MENIENFFKILLQLLLAIILIVLYILILSKFIEKRYESEQQRILSICRTKKVLKIYTVNKKMSDVAKDYGKNN